MTDDKRPWKRKRPADKKPTRLTAEWRQKARARARTAGRRYPNLVDNMWASAQQKKARRRKRRSAFNSSTSTASPLQAH